MTTVVIFPSEIQEIVWGRMNVLAALSDDSGQIVFANDNITRLYGYLPGELIGKSVDDLVPPELAVTHRQHRIEFNHNPAERAMGERLTLKGKRKDGTMFAVRIHLIPCVIRGTALTVAKVYPMPESK